MKVTVDKRKTGERAMGKGKGKEKKKIKNKKNKKKDLRWKKQQHGRVRHLGSKVVR